MRVHLHVGVRIGTRALEMGGVMWEGRDDGVRSVRIIVEGSEERIDGTQHPSVTGLIFKHLTAVGRHLVSPTT